MYWPPVGVSNRPRIESSVDLPQPDGPAIETYSPCLISRWMPESAWVSTSSVRKTFVTPSSLIRDSVLMGGLPICDCRLARWVSVAGQETRVRVVELLE